nr:hypothetical protein HK105_001306 [Polyrhizophydium stewartii]
MSNFGAPEAVAVVFAVGVVAFGASMVPALLRLPHTTYSIMLRILAISLFISIIFNIVFTVLFPIDTRAVRVMASFFSIFGSALFPVAQLEFLKQCTPFTPIVTPALVSTLQSIMAFFGIIIIGTSFSSIMPEAWQPAIYSMLLIWGNLSGLTEIAMQSFLLHFVFSRLEYTSQLFRMQFALLIATAFMILMAVSIISAMSPAINFGPGRAILTTASPAFIFCSIKAILLVRRELHHHMERVAEAQAQGARRLAEAESIALRGLQTSPDVVYSAATAFSMQTFTLPSRAVLSKHQHGDSLVEDETTADTSRSMEKKATL